MGILSSPSRRRALRVAATVVVVAIVGVLFARALAENWDRVAETALSPSWHWAVAVVLFALAVVVSSLLWRSIVVRLAPDGFRVSRRDGVRVGLASWLLKYIPGGVGSLVNKVVWGAQVGLSRALIVITFLYENVFLQVASLVPGIAILLALIGGASFGENWATFALPVIALIPLLAVLVPSWFRRLLSLPARLVLKRDLPPEYFLPLPATAGLLAGFVLPRIVNGAGFIVMSAAVIDLTVREAWLLWAAYAVAGAVGILAVFVPSGIGVREGVLAVCLVAGGIAPADAAILAILARLLSTVADAVVAVIYAALRGARPTPPVKEPVT